jgi:hypothetical protein
MTYRIENGTITDGRRIVCVHYLPGCAPPSEDEEAAGLREVVGVLNGQAASFRDVDCSRCRGGGCEWCHNSGRAHVLMTAHDANELDSVVHLLAIEDDCITPTEAVQTMMDELTDLREQIAAKENA